MTARLAMTAALLCACSGSRDIRPGDTDADTGLDTAPFTDDDTGDDTSPSTEPDHFSLDGTLVLAGGTADAAASTFDVGFYAGDSLLCSVSATPGTVTAIAATDESVPLFGWWSVTLPEAGDASCAWPLPAGLTVGIGALDSRLLPAMSAAGLSTSDTTLYGLYAQYQDTPVYVYGVAGTAANFDGFASPVAAAPLPDGTYQLQALHLLPLVSPSR